MYLPTCNHLNQPAYPDHFFSPLPMCCWSRTIMSFLPNPPDPNEPHTKNFPMSVIPPPQRQDFSWKRGFQNKDHIAFSVAGMWTGYALSELCGGAIVYGWQTTKSGEESALPTAWGFTISPRCLYADIREITCGLA